MTSPMPPEPSSADWDAVEAEYVARIEAAHAALVDRMLEAHRWDGGYFCRCGIALNSPNGWGRHLLTATLEALP